MTVLPRAATADELIKLRSDNQSSRLYLTIHSPATVYTARLASVPSSTDSVVSISYNSGSGTHTNILADQTLMVGTTAGAADLGQCRLRSTAGIGATSGTFAINETSEIRWSANAYLTVIDEFGLWAKPPRQVGTTTYMDYAVAYSDQHSKCDGVPVMGPCYVAWLNGSTVSITPDGSQSWALNNTITGYSWAAPGASATSGLTTATPTITYNATGTYRIALTVSNSDAKSFTGYRYVFVVNENYGLITSFSLDDCSVSLSEGGGSFRVTMFDEADLTSIRDRAFVVLHARDWYGTTEGSVGYVAGSEHIIACGWLDGQTINWRPEHLPGLVEFTVTGPQAWLGRISAFPEGLKDTNSAPTKWTRFLGLTAKSVSWHMLHWRTTATRCMDVYPMNNAWRAARIEAPGASSLWEQLSTMLDQTILAAPVCDSYGRLFLQVNQQVLSTAERASIPTVMTITNSDWHTEIRLERTEIPRCSLVDFSGVAFDGTNPQSFRSLAPGHVFKRYGTPDARDKMVLTTQEVCNQRAAAYLGWKNLNLSGTVELAANNRLMDIAPYQYVVINITSTDTARGITATNQKFVVTGRSLTYQSGYLTTHLEIEQASVEDISITDIVPPLIVPEPLPTPPPIPITPPVPIITADGAGVWLSHENATANPPRAIIYSTDFFSSLGNPTWHVVSALPADLKTITGHQTNANGSYLYLIGKDTSDHDAVWYATTPTGTPTWTKAIKYDDVMTTATNPVDGQTYNMRARTMNEWDDSVNGSMRVQVACEATLGTFPAPVPFPYYYCQFNDATINTRGGAGKFTIGSYRVDRGPWGLWTHPISLRGGFGTSTGIWGYMPDFYNGSYAHPDGLGFQPDNTCAGTTLFGVSGNIYFKKLGFSNTWSIVYTGRQTLGFGNLIRPYSHANSVYIPMDKDGTSQYQIVYSEDGAAFTESTQRHSCWPIIRSAKLQGGRFVLISMGGVGTGLVINSNVPVRHCADLSDETTYPWTDDTGNMWSGGSPVFTSGNLVIKNMTVTYNT